MKTKTITIVNDGGVYDISCNDEFKDLLASWKATFLEHASSRRRVLGYLSLQDGGNYRAVCQNIETTLNSFATITPKRTETEEEAQEQDGQEEDSSSPRTLPLPQRLKLNDDEERLDKKTSEPLKESKTIQENSKQAMVVSVSKTPRCNDLEQQQQDEKPPLETQEMPTSDNDSIPNHQRPDHDSCKDTEEQQHDSKEAATSEHSSHEEPQNNINTGNAKDVKSKEFDATEGAEKTKDTVDHGDDEALSKSSPSHDATVLAQKAKKTLPVPDHIIITNTQANDAALLMSLRQDDLDNDENMSPNQANKHDPDDDDADSETSSSIDKKQDCSPKTKRTKETNINNNNNSPSQIPRPNEWISSPPRYKRRKLVLDPAEQQEDAQSELSSCSSPSKPKKTFTLSEYLVEAKALLDKGKYRLAVLLYEKALPLQMAALGERNVQVAQTCFQMGRALRHLNRKAASMSLHQQALEIRIESLPKNDSRIADSYNAIAAVHHDQGQYDQAMQAYQRALQIRLETFGSRHAHVAQIYFNMGWILQKQLSYHQARKAYEQALDIYLGTYQADHRLVQSTREQIAKVNGELNVRVL